MPSWDEDSPQLRENLEQLITRIVRDAGRRVLPTRELARKWQQLFLKDLDVLDIRYKGHYRGEQSLERVRVTIGDFEGVSPSEVSGALTRFEDKLQAFVALMDNLVAVRQEPDEDQVEAIIDSCAWAHAEWIRIHPFANGNGRTARLWANWIAVRYGLPPFVRLRPRPSDGYGKAGAAAMRGDWQQTIAVFRQLLNQCLSEP